MNLQKIGKALMLPVAIFPIVAILSGLGSALAHVNNQDIHFIAVILQESGNAILQQMPITFAIGIAYGLSDDQSGYSALNGMLAFLIITTLLSSNNVSIYQNAEIHNIDAAFEKINNQFFGILSGAIAASCYNFAIRHKLQHASKIIIAFLSTILVMIFLSIFLYFLWPIIYITLIEFGTTISDLGPLGAGIYAFLNRLLIPIGMHHTINSVFWFDVVGINDIGNFWSSHGTLGITGMYQAGFFPIMMFGLPGIALAMLKTAYPKNKMKVKSFLMSAAFASFFTGVTEPLEFAFMFIAPPLYLLHAFLTGICVFIAAQFQWIAGFSFSAGAIDFVLSYSMPLAKSPYMLIFLGLLFGAIYYFSFTYFIRKFHMHTIGREPAETPKNLANILTHEQAEYIANTLVQACGGWENIEYVNCCITRIRFSLINKSKFDTTMMKTTGAIELIYIANEIQIVYGPQADYIMNVIDQLKPKKM